MRRKDGTVFTGFGAGAAPAPAFDPTLDIENVWPTDLLDLAQTGLETPKSRRNMPPELVYAIDLERLFWTLKIKGLAPADVDVSVRSPRLGVRFATAQKAAEPGKTLTLKAALRLIETLRPVPALVPADADVRAKVQAFERWMTGEVADSVMWCLLRPPVSRGAAGFSDQFMTSLIMRALDVVASLGLHNDRPYLFGNALSSADITAAAVLAPVVRKEGWAWAGQSWTPLSLVAGRSALVRHPGAAWVREMYARHAHQAVSAPEQTRAWVP
jgi:glutathione S-transferase